MNHPLRSLLSCALALAAFFAFAANASATNFCVGAGITCDQNFAFTADGFSAAIGAYEASDPADDNIFIAPGTIEFVSGLNIEDGSQGDVNVIGAGSGKTKLVFNGVDAENLYLDFAGDSTVSGLMVDAIGALPEFRTGVGLHGGKAEDVFVQMGPGSNVAFGFALTTECQSCRAKVSGSAIAFHVATGTATINDSKAEVYDPESAGQNRGLVLEEITSTIMNRTRLVNFDRALFTHKGGLTIKDSLIDLGDQQGAVGLEVNAYGTWYANPYIFIDGTTIVGSGAEQRGISATADGTGPGSINASFANSLAYLTGTDSVEIYCSHTNSVPLNLGIYYSLTEVISDRE